MIYRRFGKTNLQMPVLSSGGMRFQQGWKEVPFSEITRENQANLEATVRHALDVGINHIETARGYGASEVQLGQILPSLPRDKMIIQTKVAPTANPKEFRATVERSLATLRLDFVDLLSIHGINTAEHGEWSTRPGGCLAVAREFQKMGRCRHVGFSTHAPVHQIVELINHEEDGGFDFVNLHWYFILQRNWPAVVAAKKRDLGVFIISPSDKGGKLYAPPAKLVELCSPLHPMVFNDLYCLSHPEVHTLSIGAARPSDYDKHLEALPLMDKAPQVLAPILKRLGDAMEAATGHRDPEALVWTLPEHFNMPGDLNFPMMIWMRNLVRGWDMLDYGKMRYNLLGNGGHWFPGLNLSKLEGVDQEAIKRAIAGSPLADRAMALVQEAHELMGGDSVKRLSQS